MEFGCHTLPFARFSFEAALDAITAAGYRLCGLGLTHEGVAIPGDEATAVDLAAIRRQLEDRGLRPAMLFGLSWSRLPVEEGVVALKRRVDHAGALGCRFVLTAGTWGYRRFPDELLSPAERAPLDAACCEVLAAAGEYAAANGITILIKPHTGNTATGYDCRQTAERVDSRGVRVCYDAGNVRFYEGLDPVADVRDCLELTQALCIKDHRGPRAHRDFPVPGEGEVDHIALFRTLLAAGFDGPAIVERVDGTDTNAELSLATLGERITQARANLERAYEAAKSGGRSDQ